MTDTFVEAIAERVVALLGEKIKTAGPVAPRLLTMAQAAVYLGRSLEAMRHLSKGGSIPVVRSDGRVFFDVQDLDSWIQANKG